MPTEALPNKQITQYQFERASFHVTGLVPMPGAGPAGTPSIHVRVHAPVEREVITWVAKCDGGPPVCPSPYGPTCPFGLNDNLILLETTIGGVSPTPIGGGMAGHIFVMSGTYIYSKVAAAGPVTDFPLGKLPFDTSITAADAKYPKEGFDTGILDPGPAAAAVPTLRPRLGP